MEEFFLTHSLPADHTKIDEMEEMKSTAELLTVDALSP